MVYALPLWSEALSIFLTGRVLVIVLDLNARSLPAEAHLKQAFGLTFAESRLVTNLAGGEALDDAADRLEIGKETARSQLKSVFAKTDTCRQSELVALIGRLLSDVHKN